MKLFIFWAQTVIITRAIRAMRELKFYQDLADRGYFVDLNKASDLGDQINPVEKGKNRLLGWIPVLNVIGELENLKNYMTHKEDIIDSLERGGVLKEMTELEAKLYQEKPTPFHAFTMNVNRHVYDQEVVNHQNEEEGEIYFQIEDNQIKILKQTGCAEHLPKEETEERIKEIIKEAQTEEKEKVKRLTRKGR